MNLLPLEPPSCDLHFTPLVSTEHQAELPMLSSSFPLVPCFNHQFSSVHLLSHVQVFATPWTAARQASLSITNSQSLLKLMSIESVMPSNHLILSLLFSSPLLSFPASGAFQMSQLFTWGGQRTGVSASASVLPMNTQESSPLGWTGWISVQSKGLARVFSSISAMVVYVCQEGSSVCPPLLLLCPHICSLYLCKYCLNRYTWNLKKWCWWTYLLSRNVGTKVVLKLCGVKLSRHKIHGQSFHAFYEVKETHSKMVQRRRKWQPTPVFLPGESHGQRSLAGYSAWGHKSQTQLSD